jgi:hypothetical protein
LREGPGEGAFFILHLAPLRHRRNP